MADDNFDASDDLDYYHDDPDQEINAKPDRKKNIVIGFCASVVLILSAIFYLPSSIGGSIAINTGVNKEFGVGVTRTAACSGTQPLVLALSSTKLMISSIVVSNIPTSCANKDFIIRAYDESGAKLPLFNATATDAYINMGLTSIFKAGLDSTGMTVATITSSKFSVVFDTPVSDSVNVHNITIESAPAIPLCAQLFQCSVGDVGPGGGTVIYVDEIGFKCGPDWTLTGSRSGGKCYFLEVAPASWNSTAGDPQLPWCPTSNNCPVDAIQDQTTVGVTDIGRGYNYSKLIAAAYAGSSAAIARSYAGGGLTDWYQPNRGEFNLMSRYAKFGPSLKPTTDLFTQTYTCVGTVTSPYLGLTYCNLDSKGASRGSDYGFVNEYNSSRGWYGKPATGSSENGAGKGPPGFRIRPIRAF